MIDHVARARGRGVRVRRRPGGEVSKLAATTFETTAPVRRSQLPPAACVR